MLGSETDTREIPTMSSFTKKENPLRKSLMHNFHVFLKRKKRFLVGVLEDS